MADTKTLPQPTWPAGFQGQIGADAYTADQMRAYAAAALAAQAQADRCTSCNGTGDLIDHTGEWRGYCVCPDGVALKAQPVRQPLTDERITQCWGESQGTRNGYVPFARAVERAHHIGQEGGAA